MDSEIPQLSSMANEQLTEQAKRILEAILFVSSEPISANKIKDILETYHPFSMKEIKELLGQLQQEYISQDRAFCLEEIAQGYILRTHEKYGRYLELLGKNRQSNRLSPSAAEVLAIVAYRQPITKAQIEAIRGVDSSSILAGLQERQLVEAVGKLEVPGRPTLYGTTKEFLKHFGLNATKDLPQLE